MILGEFFERLKYWHQADRLGPDIPLTHWRLYFRRTGIALCKRKFGYFADTAEFRPGAYAIACSRISLGQRVVIRPSTMLFADPRPEGMGIVIEDDVLLGSGVHIYCANHRFSDPSIPIIDQGHSPAQPVILRRGCWVGANAVILPGVEIGRHTVVGAGSIVTRSLPAYVVAAGNPCKVRRPIASEAAWKVVDAYGAGG